MVFDPDSIDRLSPGARVEVQDYYARKYLADRERRSPERRAHRPATAEGPPAPGVAPVPAEPTPRPRWPRAVWFRNDSRRVSSNLPTGRR
jgi:hypothetical protein